MKVIKSNEPLRFETAIIDRDFLNDVLRVAEDEGLKDVEITIRTEGNDYDGPDLNEILDDIEKKNVPIKSVSIYAREEWDTKTHGFDAPEPKERKKISLHTIYGLSVNVDGDSTTWIEGVKARIGGVVNKGTWKERLGGSKWFQWSILPFSSFSGIAIALAISLKSRPWAITSLVGLGLTVAYGVFGFILITRKKLVMIPTSHADTRAAKRLTPKEKRIAIIGFVSAIGASIVSGVLGALITLWITK